MKPRDPPKENRRPWGGAGGLNLVPTPENKGGRLMLLTTQSKNLNILIHSL